MPLPPYPLRVAVADVVHEVISESAECDGRGVCAVYAYLGCVVARAFTGVEYAVQGGSFQIVPADDFAMMFDAIPSAPLISSRFHAWVVSADHSQVFDLSARHYRAWVEAAGLTWPSSVPEMPFIWVETDALPAYLRLLADSDSVFSIREEFQALVGKDLFEDMVRDSIVRIRGRGFPVALRLRS